MTFTIVNDWDDRAIETGPQDGTDRDGEVQDGTDKEVSAGDLPRWKDRGVDPLARGMPIGLLLVLTYHFSS